MSDTPINDVSDTALWVANFRASETKRPDALFRDPLAERLVAGRGEAILKQMGDSSPIEWVVTIRTVIIDDLIRDAIGQGFDAILNLGAGLDTRPYRLDLPADFQWVEADFPNTIAFKEARLAQEKPRCRLTRVSVDLSDAVARKALLAQVAATAKKVFVLTEGVVPYLTNAQVAELADALQAQPEMAAWLLEQQSAGYHKFRNRSPVVKQLKNAPFQFQPDDWDAFFKAHGWKAKQSKWMMIEGRRLGRTAPFARSFGAKVALMLMPKSRREQLEKASAFTLLERA